MKLTNLDIVQRVLSRLDSDEVNSVNDTTESRQVLELVRIKYYDIIVRTHLPEHTRLFQLTASGDNDLPVVMYKPDEAKTIDWIKYHNLSDDLDVFSYVTILPFQQFIDMMHSLVPTDDNVDSLTIGEFLFYFKNDRQPCYCTVMDDSTVIFDSYDIDVDTTLQSSKIMCMGLCTPTFLLDDDFIPDLDETQFPLLLNEVTAAAFADLKQTTNPRVDLEVRRQWNTLEKNKKFDNPHWFDRLPNFGRRGHSGRLYSRTMGDWLY